MTKALLDLIGAHVPPMATPDPPPPPEDLAIAGRGRLLTLADVEGMFFGRRSQRWIKTHVAPEKRILIGDMWCMWECDLRDWFDAQRGLPSPKRRAHLLGTHAMRGLINEAVARRTRERARAKRPPQ